MSKPRTPAEYQAAQYGRLDREKGLIDMIPDSPRTRRTTQEVLADGQEVFRPVGTSPDTGIAVGVVRCSRKMIIIEGKRLGKRREQLDPEADYSLCPWRPSRREAVEWAMADLIRDAERLEGGARGRRSLAAEWGDLLKSSE